MLLNENSSINNRKLSHLEKGDRIAIKSPGKELEYAVVHYVNGNEILMFQPKTNKGYRLYTPHAIDGDIINYFPGKANSKSKRPFEYIIVTDSSNNKKFTIVPGDEKEEEEEENLSPEEEAIRKALDNERSEIYNKAADIVEGDTFSMMFGEVEVDEDGNYTSKFKKDSTSQAYFKCNTIYEEVIIATLLNVEGAMADSYESLIDESVSFSLDEDGLFNKTNNGVSIKGMTNNKKQVNFQFVYYFNVESQENDEGSNSANIKPGFNKDLMRLIQHRTWKDRLLGRDGKGIVPLEKIRQDYLGGKVADKKYVTFVLDKDVIVGTGKNLKIKKGEETYGKFKGSGKIVVFGKNGKQAIHLFLKNTKDPNRYNVQIEVRDSNNNKEVMGHGELTIINK
jgi:hypothetical protein